MSTDIANTAQDNETELGKVSGNTDFKRSSSNSEFKRSTSDSEITPSVDKIRDIIFGSQMRDYEARFVAIESRISKESARLRQDLEERMDALENLVQNEFDSLANKLLIEKKERSESLLTAETILKKNNEFLSQRLSDLESKYLEEIRKLRTQEHEDIKMLRNNLQQLRQEFTAQLEKDIEFLRKNKVDKASVAALFAAGNS